MQYPDTPITRMTDDLMSRIVNSTPLPVSTYNRIYNCVHKFLTEQVEVEEKPVPKPLIDPINPLKVPGSIRDTLFPITNLKQPPSKS